MSSSEAPGDLGGAVAVVQRYADDPGLHAGATADDARRLLAAATRLYAAKEELGEMDPPIGERDVTTTEAVTGAAALMHAQHLNPFDLQLWISRTPEPD